jgi:hypothetical protein
MKILGLIPQWGLGIGIVILAISISFALIYLVVKRNVSIKSKYINVSTFIKQFGHVIKESMKSAKDMCFNEQTLRPMEQMDYVDDKIDEIYDMTMDIHSELLKSKVVLNDVTQHPQSQNFSNMLATVLEGKRGIKKEIKRRFKKLLIIYPAQEYKDYKAIELDFLNHKEDAVKTIVLQVSKKIKRSWVKNEYIEFSEIEDAMQPIMKEIENKVAGAFQHAIGVQYKIYNKNCLIYNEIDEMINNIEEK